MTNKRLWAPWRIQYIKNFKKEKGCLFCRVFKSKQDAKNLVIFRSQNTLVMLNLYPYNNGHLMVAPIRHVATLELLKPDEIADLMQCVNKAKLLLDKTLKPEGYNIGCNVNRIAGAGFDQHLHIHIVPRWAGDTNFMTPLCNTRVISQSLHELYEELSKNNK
ncbi:MAG: HIT domain-containing protein [Candidatus Omnitrophota bacterium]